MSQISFLSICLVASALTLPCQAQFGGLKGLLNKAKLPEASAPSKEAVKSSEGEGDSAVASKALGSKAQTGPRPEAEGNEGPKLAIFAKNRITSNTPSDATTVFGGEDRIYVRFVLPKSLRQYHFSEGTMYPTVTILLTTYQEGVDQPNSGEARHVLSQGDLDQNFVDVEILPDPQNAQCFNDCNLAHVFTQCQPGKIYARIRAKVEYGQFETLGHGDFEMDLSAARLARIPADRELAQKVSKAFEAAGTGLSKDFHDKGNFRDPMLSLASIKKFVLRDMKDVAEVLKIAIREGGGEDWEVHMDGGIPKFMLNKRRIFLAYKSKDGKFYYAPINLRRNYQGGGKYGEVFAEYEGGGITQFNGKLS